MFNSKKWLCATLFVGFTSFSQAAQCDYTADKSGFKLGFTGFGFPDKSYDVKNNTFTSFKIESSEGKLLNGSITIDTKSVDTTADKRNWDRNGEWPAATLTLRNSNIANGLFGNFSDGGAIKATVTAIEADALTLSVAMNGATKEVKMPYKVENGVLNAKGNIDLMDFNAGDALKAFAAVCTNAWHRGKTWTDVEIYFSVPVSETGCQ